MGDWKWQWNTQVAPTRLPGVWKRKKGGYLVRARVRDAMTGRTVEIRRVLPTMSMEAAFAWLAEARDRVKSGNMSGLTRAPRFCDYAVSLLERRLLTREVRSARGRERWKYTLEHLIAGADDVAGFGELTLTAINRRHIEAWRVGVARLIARGVYAPTTANGWLQILRHIFRNAVSEGVIQAAPTDGVRAFDTSEHATYTEEEPNALSPEEVAAFLDCAKAEYPQHFAMILLGFATGLRPSSMRPLRRKGDHSDILWDQGIILVRRSHTLAQEVMNSTKTGLRQRIHVGPSVMNELRRHVDTQLRTQQQRESDLLFPGADGGLRSETVLVGVFRTVSSLIRLKKRFTPRGMRRTFNDLARLADAEPIVTKSISGHTTERMRERYSTVSPDEQRRIIGMVLQLAQFRPHDDVEAPGAATESGALG